MTAPREEFEAALLAYDEAYESSDYEAKLRDKVCALHAAALAESLEVEVSRLRDLIVDPKGEIDAMRAEVDAAITERDEWRRRYEEE